MNTLFKRFKSSPAARYTLVCVILVTTFCGLLFYAIHTKRDAPAKKDQMPTVGMAKT